MSLKKNLLNIGTYNVHSARGESRLEQALKALSPMKLDVCILTETNLQDLYPRQAHGWTVSATFVNKGSYGGVALLSKSPEKAPWHLESTKTYGENVISTLITSGWRRWNLIGTYLPPSAPLSPILDQIAAAARRSSAPIILEGDLNCRLSGDRVRDIEIAASISSIGASVDLADHFRIQRHFHHRHTWRSTSLYMSAKCDYIVGTDRRNWQGLRYTQPRNYCSDHLMIIGSLIVRTSLRIHKQYTDERKKQHFVTPKPSDLDQKFKKILKLQPKIQLPLPQCFFVL